jgi:hypothetical protein
MCQHPTLTPIWGSGIYADELGTQSSRPQAHNVLLFDRRSELGGVLAYLPLTEADKPRMVGKFVSVTRATLKGPILIGVAQGLLGGLAFWAVGIDGAITSQRAVMPDYTSSAREGWRQTRAAKTMSRMCRIMSFCDVSPNRRLWTNPSGTWPGPAHPLTVFVACR